MGKPKEEVLLSHHFSHEHPLELTNSVSTKATACFGCNQTIFAGKYYYKCKKCPFYLHQLCHNMPKTVQHPADPDHYLTLQSMISSSPNSKSSIDCKACGENLSGFYYNCDKCGDFYHILCSAVPLSVKTPTHPHVLKLEYEPPYDFQCDSCHRPSYTGWLYRCSLCEFDVHIACAITNKGAQLRSPKAMEHSPLNKEEELMELLTRGLGKGEAEEVERNMPHQDQPSLLGSEQDPYCGSYQFSDACFSIDFAKSLLASEDGSTPQRFSKLGLAQVNETETPGINKILGDHPKHTKQRSSSTHISHPHSRNSSNDSKIRLSSVSIGSRILLHLDSDADKNNGFGFTLAKSASTREYRSTASDNAKTGCGLLNFLYCRRPRAK
ncbi:uncharacterized protein LOC108222505 isoform X2 [Daucus carota subsp. sativus]|uniref:uncharacterized protein LOC108222505 isoform X2 n=1 Tax=Daucus carota subsp. sativus TaxID=79200 RepID=UPI0007B27762|nr:PREDICTED: uncharacterized protein LOC108222505 isoform X2 [Daucus carota subsp. sativus]